MNVKNYNNDGANYQAKAVLSFVQRLSDIEKSWNDANKRYDAEISVARWENCREQGYVLSMYSPRQNNQLNVAFFEHRNSDAICAVRWEQTTLNPPTIDTANFGDVYKDKYDVSYRVGHGNIEEMAIWIMEQFEEYW